MPDGTQTGATPSLEHHPFPYFHEQGYVVTLNTDNRLMSRTSMTDEYWIAARHFGCDLDALEQITVNAMRAAFYHHADRERIVAGQIVPGYEALRHELAKTG